MTTIPMYRAASGDTRCSDDFRIVTNRETLFAHVGHTATIWYPGREHATTVSVAVDGNGIITVSRDGKGDTLRFSYLAASFTMAEVFMGTQRVAWLNIGASDGEFGRFYCDEDWAQVTSFFTAIDGIVRLAQLFLV